MQKPVSIPLATLVEDNTLYPRARVDPMNVRKLVAALEAGETLPPILIEAKTRRIVDGFHRVMATRKHLGLTAEIDAIEKVYASDAELFKDAVRLNAAHGRTLSPYDCARSLVLAEQAGISRDEIASCLSITVERANKLYAQKVSVVVQNTTPMPVAIKCTVGHLAGKELTPAQVDTMGHIGGMRQIFYVNQLITLIESDLLDVANDGLMERLLTLKHHLDALFESALETAA